MASGIQSLQEDQSSRIVPGIESQLSGVPWEVLRISDKPTISPLTV